MYYIYIFYTPKQNVCTIVTIQEYSSSTRAWDVIKRDEEPH